MLRFALLILVGLQLQLDQAWAEERSVVVFDGTAVRSMPLPAYVDLLSGKPPLSLLVGLVESMPGSELADLQQQINDLRIAVAKLSAAQPAPAPVALVGACGAADACSAAGGCGAAASCGAAAGGCGAAATSGGCGSAGSAGGANYAPFQPLRNFFRSIRSRRGGC